MDYCQALDEEEVIFFLLVVMERKYYSQHGIVSWLSFLEKHKINSKDIDLKRLCDWTLFLIRNPLESVNGSSIEEMGSKSSNSYVTWNSRGRNSSGNFL